MPRFARSFAVALAMEFLAARAFADEPAGRAEPPAVPHPILTTDARWAGVLLIAIAALFVLAAVVGPIVRALAPEDHTPVAH